MAVRWGLREMWRLATAVLGALLAADTAAAAGGVPGGDREIRIGPGAGSAAGLVACAEPLPAVESALAQALRRGLFDVCEGYRNGAVSAGDYRATLEAYPALVLQMAALEALGGQQPDPEGSPRPEAVAIRRQLAVNPTLPVFCRTSAAAALVQSKRRGAVVLQLCALSLALKHHHD